MRPATADDMPFIFHAWLEGYWPNYCGAVADRKGSWCARWHGVLERILASQDTRTMVAHVDGALLGFACGDARCLHWVYVKQAFRGLGIASALLSELQPPTVGSHWAPALARAGWDYDPRLLREYGI